MDGRLVVGSVALLVAFVPLVAGATSLRRRLLPTWTGAPGALAITVLVLTSTLVVAEVLGIVGLLRVLPLVVALAGTGGAYLYLGTRGEPRQVDDAPLPTAPLLGRAADIAAVLAATAFAATWGARTYVSLNHGMVSIDTLWYHLPTAGRFAQEGSITGVYHDFRDLSGFYPVASEILHSVGMVLLDNDVLSTLLDLGWGVLILLAAWCIGRPFGLAQVTFTGAAVLLCAPGFVTTQPGGAHSDVVGVALLVTAAAVLVSAGHERLTSDPVAIALAAMPVGIAVATKWTQIPVSAAITIGVLVLLPRGARLRLGALWLAIVGGLGAFSYVRNLVDAGSPLPSIDLRIAGIGWERKVPEVLGSASVSSHLTNGDAWDEFFIPGLSQWFGYSWWLVVGLIALGLVLALVLGPGRVVRLLAVVGVVGALGYLFGPQLLEVGGKPTYFVANFRYSSVALTFGLVLLAVAAPYRRRALAWPLLAVYLAVIAIMQLDSAIWPVELRDMRMENPVTGADAWSGLVIGAVVLVAGLVLVLRRGGPMFAGPPADEGVVVADGAVGEAPGDAPRWRPPVLVLTAAGLVLVVLLVAGQHWYLGQRYTSPSAATPFLANHWHSWEWARDQHDEAIGFKHTNLYFPLMGNDQSNRADYIGLPPGASFDPLVDPDPELAATCVDLKDAVNEGEFTYVAIYGYIAPPPPGMPAPPIEETAPEAGWLESDPATSVVLREPLEVVFSIDGELDPDLCADGA